MCSVKHLRPVLQTELGVVAGGFKRQPWGLTTSGVLHCRLVEFERGYRERP